MAAGRSALIMPTVRCWNHWFWCSASMHDSISSWDKVPFLPWGSANWRDGAAPPEIARFGNEFVSAGKSRLLFVPSVLAPHEDNCLINPGHPEFGRIILQELESLSYDARMFEERVHRAKEVLGDGYTAS